MATVVKGKFIPCPSTTVTTVTPNFHVKLNRSGFQRQSLLQLRLIEWKRMGLWIGRSNAPLRKGNWTVWILTNRVIILRRAAHEPYSRAAASAAHREATSSTGWTRSCEQSEDSTVTPAYLYVAATWTKALQPRRTRGALYKTSSEGQPSSSATGGA